MGLFFFYTGNVFIEFKLFILFLLCEPLYASDCKSFQESLNIQNEAMEYVSCKINNEDQGAPIELMYRFTGMNALDVEHYLIDKFNINPIERESGHPFWNSYNINIPDEPNLKILVGSEENIYMRRDDWSNIDYFYAIFFENTRPEDI